MNPQSGQITRTRPRQPGAATSARPVRTAAQGVVAALALPASKPAPQPVRPLPLSSLDDLPHDASMLYDIGRVDASGRVANRDIVKALRWQPGDKLETIPSQGAIIIRASSEGRLSVSKRPRIIIPVTARRRHGIRPGDHVLLAAAPDYGIVIVYPPSTLNEMITCYHSAHSAAGIART